MYSQKKLRTQQLQISRACSWLEQVRKVIQRNSLLKERLLSFDKIQRKPLLCWRGASSARVCSPCWEQGLAAVLGLEGSPAVGSEISRILRDTSCLSLKSGALCDWAPGLGEGCGAIAVLNQLWNTLEGPGAAGQGGGPHGRPPRNLQW